MKLAINNSKLPKRLDRKVVYESDWINLYVDKVEMPTGRIIERYHQLDYPQGSVVVLLLNEFNEILFIESLRYTLDKINLELPAGYVGKNEDIMEAAKREISEETGYQVNNVSQIYKFYPSIGMSNQVIYVAMANVEKAVKTNNFDKDEVDLIKWIGVKDVKDKIKNKEIDDGISLIPLLLYLGGLI